MRTPRCAASRASRHWPLDGRAVVGARDRRRLVARRLGLQPARQRLAGLRTARAVAARAVAAVARHAGQRLGIGRALEFFGALPGGITLQRWRALGHRLQHPRGQPSAVGVEARRAQRALQRLVDRAGVACALLEPRGRVVRLQRDPAARRQAAAHRRRCRNLARTRRDLRCPRRRWLASASCASASTALGTGGNALAGAPPGQSVPAAHGCIVSPPPSRAHTTRSHHAAACACASLRARSSSNATCRPSWPWRATCRRPETPPPARRWVRPFR